MANIHVVRSKPIWQVTQEYALTLSSPAHNLRKGKKSLEAVIFSATNAKVTCLSENVFFHLQIKGLS